MTLQARSVQEAQPQDFLPIRAIDHVELYVGNAVQAAAYYRLVLGFDIVAYAGLETGLRDRVSYVLEQRKIRLVLTSPLGDEGPVAEHVHRHGDGVKCIAFEVDDVEQAYQAAISRGARGIEPPTRADLKTATIATYGDTVHTFVERAGYDGFFAPGYVERRVSGQPTGLAAIDHIVGNVELGQMDRWVDFYARTLGFSQLIHFDDEDISTEYSALMSKVMQDRTGRIKFPINEPATGRRKSQIQEYLDYYKGAGVQHLAFITPDIVATVGHLQSQGMEFLRVPDEYYQAIPGRVGEIRESLEEIARLGILVDRDDEGYLLQIFSRPIQSRPTMFFEFIQRCGSRGFGKGNFQALFESLELEQARRGNL